jgi:hypothetical protein
MVVLFCLSCPGCPILAVLFCLSYLLVLFRLSCAACPVCLSNSACPVSPAWFVHFVLFVLFCSSCFSCPVLQVLLCLSSFACPILSFRSVLPFLFCLPVLHEHEITSVKIKERKCTSVKNRGAQERKSVKFEAQKERQHEELRPRA